MRYAYRKTARQRRPTKRAAKVATRHMLVVNTNNMNGIITRGYIRGRTIFSRMLLTAHAGTGTSTVTTQVGSPHLSATAISTSGITRAIRLVHTFGPTVIVGITLPCRSLRLVRTYLRTKIRCLSATGCRPPSITGFRCD